MKHDDKDEYIKQHARSMSVREMADHLGINKSTVSRRMKALREDGEIDQAVAQAVKRETQQARDTLQSCAMNSSDRLSALDSLKTRLEAELDVTGGANLARVSSEYRRTLEEMASISTDLELVNDKGREVDVVAAILLVGEIEKRFPRVERHTVDDICEEVLTYLDEQSILSFTPLTKVKACSRYSEHITAGEE